MILFQFKTVCLFRLDFSIQNVLCKYTYVMLEKSIYKTCKMIFFPLDRLLNTNKKTLLNKFLQEEIICKGETRTIMF